jgi:hypothetical protein
MNGGYLRTGSWGGYFGYMADKLAGWKKFEE